MSKYATKEQIISIVQDMASKISVPTIGIGGGYAPIGTIISYMGVTAPQDYLACDGSVYNISAYPDLADFIESQFGSKNYFGGNGTTTFGVPTLTGAPTNTIYCIKAVATGGGINVDETGAEHEIGIYTDSQGNTSPLYQRYLTGGKTSTTEGATTYDLSSYGISKVTSVYSLLAGSIPVPCYYFGTKNYVCKISANTTKISAIVNNADWNNLDVNCIIQYTKTT